MPPLDKELGNGARMVLHRAHSESQSVVRDSSNLSVLRLLLQTPAALMQPKSQGSHMENTT